MLLVHVSVELMIWELQVKVNILKDAGRKSCACDGERLRAGDKAVELRTPCHLL